MINTNLSQIVHALKPGAGTGVFVTIFSVANCLGRVGSGLFGDYLAVELGKPRPLAFSFFCGQALGVAVLGLGLETLGQFGALALCAAAILILGLVTARRLAQPVRRVQLP